MVKRWMPVDEWLGQDSRKRPYQQAPRLDDDDDQRPDPNRPVDPDLGWDNNQPWPPGKSSQDRHADELARRATDGLDGSGGSRT